MLTITTDRLDPAPAAATSTQEGGIAGFSRFCGGCVIWSEDARSSCAPEELWSVVGRHESGDWGELEDTRVHANYRAIQNGGKILSIQKSAGGKALVVTTFLAPSNPLQSFTLVEILAQNQQR
ncbi:MAG: hypothetical protein JNN07_02995 [Verrucomicrobiales bacterium]|nr:hypothetical protein [Verrucomicrobiales bacterium]